MKIKNRKKRLVGVAGWILCIYHVFTGVDKFPPGARLFRRLRSIGHAKKWPLKTKVRILDTTRNIRFSSLLPKYHLQLSFLIYFH